MTISGDAFERAARKYLGVAEDWQVHVNVSGGQDVQIGDYTWDTEPHEFELYANSPKGIPHDWKNAKFDSLPDLLNALLNADSEGRE